MALNDGASAIHTCGALLVHWDDKAMWFEKSKSVGIHAGSHRSALWAMSIAVWCLGVGGHSGDSNNCDGDGDGDARGCIPEARQYVMLTNKGIYS